MNWPGVPPGNVQLVDKIVDEYMSQGKFDQLRRQLVSDMDTKPAYQNLKQRMEGAVRSFLSNRKWKPDLNKNQLRDNLTKHLLAAPFLQAGIFRVIEQVVSPTVIRGVRPDLTEISRSIQGLNETKMETDEPMETIDSTENKEEAQIEIKKEIRPERIFEVVAVPGEEPIQLIRSPVKEEPAEEVPEPSLSSEVEAKVEPDEPMDVEPQPFNPVEDDLTAELSDENSVNSVILNQMSPISYGSRSPSSPVPSITLTATTSTEFKRASDFIGKIPKIKKDTTDVKDKGGTNVGESSDSKQRESKRDDHKSSDRSKDKDRKSSSSRSRDRDGKRDSHRSRERDSKSSRSDDKSRSSSKETSRSSSSRDKSRHSGSEREKSSRDKSREGDKEHKSKSADDTKKDVSDGDKEHKSSKDSGKKESGDKERSKSSRDSSKKEKREPSNEDKEKAQRDSRKDRCKDGKTSKSHCSSRDKSESSKSDSEKNSDRSKTSSSSSSSRSKQSSSSSKSSSRR